MIKVHCHTCIAIKAFLFMAISVGFSCCSVPDRKQVDTPAYSNELFNKPEKVFPVKGKYIFKSAEELTSMIRNHEATSVDIVKEFIAHIKNNNYKYNAIVWLREKEALEEAQKADEAVAKGGKLPALLGVPVTVKEEYWVKGLPVTLNAEMYKHFIAPRDGALVKQLKNSGAIIIGKTNVPTLLMDFQVQGEIYPVASNPYDTTRTPGGSSGGAAAALAAGFTTIELGSDLGGSIRLPSSFCGLYGLKTTFRSLNVTEGDGPDTSSKKKRFALNVAGPMARTVEDLESAWLVLRDAQPDTSVQQPIIWKEPSGRMLNQFRLAWVDEWNRENTSVKTGNSVKEKLSLLIDSLKQHGVLTNNTAPDTYDEMMRSYFNCLGLLAGEGLSPEARKSVNESMKPWDDGSGTLTPFYETMSNPDEAAWMKWQEDNSKLKTKWASFFKQYDFLICPITYGPAFKKCAKGTPIKVDGTTVSYFNYAPYTTIINPTESPSLTIPLGLTEEGLPVAVQIIGPPFSEPELLYFAKLIKPLTAGFVRPNGL